MRQNQRYRIYFAWLFLDSFPGVALSLCLCFGLTSGGALLARADDSPTARRSAAAEQFARAETMRAALEAKPERQRSLQEYTQLVAAYRHVYLITPRASEVPTAIKQVGDLYRKMGVQFERKYFDLAITTYQFLAHDYPTSNLRSDALLAIADIQRNNLAEVNQAQDSYADLLKQYPRSSHAAEARKALDEMKAVDDLAAKASAPPAIENLPRTAEEKPPSAGQPSEVAQVRVWNADNYTRIVIDLGGQAKYQAARIFNPDRIYFDIQNAKLSHDLIHQPIDVPSGGYLKAVRVAQNRPNAVRVVLDVARVKDYSVFELSDPDRLVVDVYGPGAESAKAGSPPAAKATSPGVPETRPTSLRTSPAVSASAPEATTLPHDKAATTEPAPTSVSAAIARTVSPAKTSASSTSASTVSPAKTPESTSSARSDTAPTHSYVTVTRPKPSSRELASTLAETPVPAPIESAKTAAARLGPSPVPEPTRNGEHSLTRTLGLKVGRIVIDAGHGGHDTGTIGPTGLMEKDLCLDVAQRLGKLIQERLPSAEVIYTRENDTFVPLEQRTAIANEAKADLFISIHANSSEDHKTNGIETYYLNFNASPQAMEVATRENATAQSSVHDLQELVTKIARNEKVEESRDLAADLQDSLAKSMQKSSHSERDRGVRKAPFVVLIGADMPSVLTEISFLSNPAEEQWLKKPENRQRIAEGLYRGIETYLQSTNSLTTDLTPSFSGPREQ